MRPFDRLSSAELFAIHQRQMERVAECLRRSEELIQKSSALIERRRSEGDNPKAPATWLTRRLGIAS